MKARHALWLCAALLFAQSPATAQFDEGAARRAAQEMEREWLEHEFGRFASGRFAVFSGELKVRQRDREKITIEEGLALATLYPGVTHTLTIVFPDSQRWLRLTQKADRPDLTYVTRLRALNANTGVSATCKDCMTLLADLHGRDLLIRFAAEGELLDVTRSRFVVETVGHLRRIPPETLRLDQILPLGPDIATWRRRPNAPLIPQGREAIRDIANVLRHPAPSPNGNTVRFTCNYETRYTAQHFVNLNDLTRFGVRNLALGDTDLCCVDHALHDGSKTCTEEPRGETDP